MSKEMKVIPNAIGRCTSCGRSLKTVADGTGFQVGPLVADVIDSECAGEISALFLAHEGRVSVLAQFKSDPIAYLTEHGFLDGRGRVKPEYVTKTN
jgi:hypothetical protein